MRERPPHATLHSSLVLATTSCLVACNAILGIDPPTDAPRSSDIVSSHGDDYEGDFEELDAGAAAQPADAGADALTLLPLDALPHAWAAWPMPNPSSLADAAVNPQRLSVSPADVVVDGTTKLQWQRSVEAEPRARDEAEAYCTSLALDGGGFRLPTRIELVSLVDFTQSGSYLDPESFPGAPSGKYWTASPCAGDRANGWVINFAFGTTLVQNDATSKKYLVRCVR